MFVYLFSETSYVAPELCAKKAIVPHYSFTGTDLSTFDKEINLAQPDIHIIHKTAYVRCRPCDAVSYLRAMCPDFESHNNVEEIAQLTTSPRAVAKPIGLPPLRVAQPIGRRPQRVAKSTGPSPLTVVRPIDPPSRIVPVPPKKMTPKELASLYGLKSLSVVLHRDERISISGSKTVPKPQVVTKFRSLRRKFSEANQTKPSAPKFTATILDRDKCRTNNDTKPMPTTTKSAEPNPKRTRINSSKNHKR